MWVNPCSVAWACGAEQDCFVGLGGCLCELLVDGLVDGVGEVSLSVVFGVFGEGGPSWWCSSVG